MAVLVLLLFRFIRLLGSGHEALAVENAALRLQLLTYQRKRIRPKLTTFRSSLLVHAVQTLASLENCPACGATRHSCKVARERFRKFWARLSNTRYRPRQTHRCSRDTTLDPQDGDSESALASTSHSRRTQDARNQGVGANCVTHSSLDSTTAIAKLEDFPAEPHRSNRGCRLFCRADVDLQNFVRVYCSRAPKT